MSDRAPRLTARACLGWALLIAVLCAAVYGIATTRQPHYLQWGKYCNATDLYPSDYVVRFFREEGGGPGCLWYQLLGAAPERPLFVLVGAIAVRVLAVAALLMFVHAVYGNRVVTVLAIIWLVARFGLWPAISSLNITETLVFAPRAVAAAQILLGLALVTLNRPLLAGLVLGTGLYTQGLNTGHAILVAIVFMTLRAATTRDWRRHAVGMAYFIAAILALGWPYALAAERGSFPPGFLREWTTMRFVSEPDDASLLFTFEWLGPEWYALHVLGFAALGIILGLRPRAWLQHPAGRWLAAVWIVLGIAAVCELLYLRLPEFPFLIPLRFEFRRIVWLSGLLMVAAIVAAIVKSAASTSPAVRRAGLTAAIVALALPIVRFYPSTLAILLVLTVPIAVLSEMVSDTRRRALVCFAMVATALIVPQVVQWVVEAIPAIDATFGSAIRAVARSGVHPAAILPIAALIAGASWIAKRFAGHPQRVTAALALYTVVFFGWPGLSTPEGLTRSPHHIRTLASVEPLSLRQWHEFVRLEDDRIDELVAAGTYRLSGDLEDAAAAAERLTPIDAVLLVRPDAHGIRGLSGRSVLMLEDEDNEMSHYSPLIWSEFRARFYDVVGWDYLQFARLQRARSADVPSLHAIYRALTPQKILFLAERYGVTHVLADADHVLPFEQVYRNRQYVLYRIESRP